MDQRQLVDDKLQEYKSLQIELQKLYLQKQQSLSQLNENVLVKGELDLLKEGSKVYKLVGPVLLTVELEEAKDNVEKRLEFIEKELKRIDELCDTKQKEHTEIGNQIAQAQQKMQMEAAAAAGKLIGATGKE